MPISLHKVTKKIKAKKGGKLDSLGRRDSKKLNRATLRDQKLKKLGTSRSKLKEVELVRVGYFKVETKDATVPLSTTEVRDLVERWVHRDDAELSRMQSERRAGRPASPKEDLLKQRINRELEEFRTGFYVPDLQSWENMEWLQRWDGSVGALAQVKFVRISKDESPVEIESPVEMELSDEETA
ncbi:translation machinery-associated protein 16 [Maublancomyces gigas]|uniref:Translation machinery-associated protein 16 n=1 Tax=Discina gigas TaxID=1032678 RepID=A0ABR3GPM8_9PEZI